MTVYSTNAILLWEIVRDCHSSSRPKSMSEQSMSDTLMQTVMSTGSVVVYWDLQIYTNSDIRHHPAFIYIRPTMQ